MPKPTSTGSIEVQFSPPVPKDLGSALRWKIIGLLGKEGRCSAYNTTSLGDPWPEGWALGVEIKKATATAEWTERLREFLLAEPLTFTYASPRLEVSIRRGTLELTVATLSDPAALSTALKSLLPKQLEGGSVSVLMVLPDPGDFFAPLEGSLRACVSQYGRLTNAYQAFGKGNISVKIDHTANLPRYLTDLLPHIAILPKTEEIRLFLNAESKLEIYPLLSS